MTNLTRLKPGSLKRRDNQADLDIDVIILKGKGVRMWGLCGDHWLAAVNSVVNIKIQERRGAS
jgi:hypothetical protein